MADAERNNSEWRKFSEHVDLVASRYSADPQALSLHAAFQLMFVDSFNSMDQTANYRGERITNFPLFSDV